MYRDLEHHHFRDGLVLPMPTSDSHFVGSKGGLVLLVEKLGIPKAMCHHCPHHYWHWHHQCSDILG